MDSAAHPHMVARMQIKPSPFYNKSPALWFKQMESQFFLAGIHSPVTKYHHAMAVLPEDVVYNVTDLTADNYDELKSAVLDSLKANRSELIDRAMATLELGERKPSHPSKQLYSVWLSISLLIAGLSAH